MYDVPVYVIWEPEYADIVIHACGDFTSLPVEYIKSCLKEIERESGLEIQTITTIECDTARKLIAKFYYKED